MRSLPYPAVEDVLYGTGAPSMDQVDALMAIVAEHHPLRTGNTLHGVQTSFDGETLSIAIQVTEGADEIFAAPRTRCVRVDSYGRRTTSVLEGHHAP
jgi:hypothetical protein